MKISLNLSGAPSVLKDGKRVVFPTKKAEAIFYYVALVGQVSKSALELIFWPELDQLGANKNLRNSIYYITKIFGRDVFKKDRGVLEFSDGVELELLTERSAENLWRASTLRIARISIHSPKNIIRGKVCASIIQPRASSSMNSLKVN